MRTLPSIEQGNDARLKNLEEKKCSIVIQEKIDGSQLTIFKKDGKLFIGTKIRKLIQKANLGLMHI